MTARLSLHVSNLTSWSERRAEEIRSEGVSNRLPATRSLDVRYRGVDSYLTIPWPSDDDFARAFAAAHRQRYGYTHEGRPLEIVAARVEVVGRVGDELPWSEHVTPSEAGVTANCDCLRWRRAVERAVV